MKNKTTDMIYNLMFIIHFIYTYAYIYISGYIVIIYSVLRVMKYYVTIN